MRPGASINVIYIAYVGCIYFRCIIEDSSWSAAFFNIFFFFLFRTVISPAVLTKLWFEILQFLASFLWAELIGIGIRFLSWAFVESLCII